MRAAIAFIDVDADRSGDFEARRALARGACAVASVGAGVIYTLGRCDAGVCSFIALVDVGAAKAIGTETVGTFAVVRAVVIDAGGGCLAFIQAAGAFVDVEASRSVTGVSGDAAACRSGGGDATLGVESAQQRIARRAGAGSLLAIETVAEPAFDAALAVEARLSVTLTNSGDACLTCRTLGGCVTQIKAIAAGADCAWGTAATAVRAVGVVTTANAEDAQHRRGIDPLSANSPHGTLELDTRGVCHILGRRSGA